MSKKIEIEGLTKDQLKNLQEMRTQHAELFGWVIDDVVSKRTCREIINYGRPTLKPATTFAPVIQNYRTNWASRTEYGNNKSVDKVYDLVRDFTQVPIKNFEKMQIVHYKSGQYYKEHFDFLIPNQEYYEKQMKMGGQRIWTAFLYLNDVSNGGETYLRKAWIRGQGQGFKIKPQAGRMVLWMNMIDGKTINNSLHEALPPIDCEKWGAVIWIREKKYEQEN